MNELLANMLGDLRIRASVLLRETYPVSFSVRVPGATELRTMLGDADAASTAVAFHLAEAGSFEIRREGRGPVVVQQGGVALGFGGEPHELATGEPARRVEFADLLTSAPPAFGPRPSLPNATAVRIVCGAVRFEHTRLHPLFEALPDVLVLPDDSASSLGLAMRVADELDRGEVGAEFVVGRLIEALCAVAIRRHATGSDHHPAPGWFRGCTDRDLGTALGVFHAHPGRAWTVALLAEAAHLSPSRFAARFRDAFGMAPMTYVTRWRMHLATRMLAEGDDGIERIAARLGYDSKASFSRAFKRWLGKAPSEHRRSAVGPSVEPARLRPLSGAASSPRDTRGSGS